VTGQLQLGAVLPQAELSADPRELRAYACGLRELGVGYVRTVDHVVGAERRAHPELRDLPYDSTSVVHEPFVLLAFIAGCAPGLELVTAVLVLPQRQTVLVAKQAAELDLLANGKTRLGIGLGWNPVEYQALGQSFSDRGSRVEEQIGLLRRLWTEEVVTAHGDHHAVDGAGIRPMPVQRPIPLWLGGTASAALRRAARLGDGYMIPGLFSGVTVGTRWPTVIEEMRRQRASDTGLDTAFGIEARVSCGPGTEEALVAECVAMGVTHLALSTTGLGLWGVEAHLQCLAETRQRLAL
jgi:probable F420-dependent oxidoreductase